jgi:formate hydrogenlyase transcriptional activator
VRRRRRRREEVSVGRYSFRALAETASDLFFQVRADGRILDVNQEACRALRYARQKLLRLSLEDVCDVTPDALSLLMERAAKGDPITFEAVQRRQDGEAFPVEVRAGALRSGGETQLVLLARDVTERRRAQVELREREDQLARILEAAMDAIIVVDSRFRVHLCNPAAHRIFGCPRKRWGTGPSTSSSRARRRTSSRSTCARQRNGGKLERHIQADAGLSGLRADGTEFPFEATISGTETGNRQRFVIILRDVSERIQAEKQIRKLSRERVYLREVVELHPGGLIGASEPMRKVFKDIETVAPTDYTVLIAGETGTGKELVARAVHQASKRSAGVLVTVNCAALPPSLVETEFFGHERGAFTGALSRRLGRFEMADGGTIFLDEISATSLDIQTKLLRVLQEGEFERVGGARTIPVDVRVIAATNRDLLQAVETGAFRSDLFYRLNVFPIRLPPLRERKEDIPLLVRHFAARCGPKVGKRIDTVSRKALDSLMDYEWPGNVRELQNVVERAVILSPGSELVLGDWHPAGASPSRTMARRTLDEVQREHILKVLEATGGRVSGERGAARVLGLKPTTLESRMKKLGIYRKSPGSSRHIANSRYVVTDGGVLLPPSSS